MIVFYAIAVGILFLYFILIYFYTLGFKNYPSYIPQNLVPASISATILIPCRNPSDQLKTLLAQLFTQVHPNNSIEILVINDFSDNEIVVELNGTARLLNLRDNRSDLSVNKNNKKEAIAFGVAESKQEYIICLDCDISLSDNWWTILSNFILDKKPQFAAGLHRYISSKTWLNNFLTLEQDILTASSIAALQLRMPTMCNGANMIFSKKAFYDVKGYDGLYHTTGGDDLFLYHRIYAQFPNDTHYIKNLDAAVYSKAPQSILELLKQRSRWMSKTSHYENLWVNLHAGIILISNFLCFLALFIWILWPIFILKLVADIFFISHIQKFYPVNMSLLQKLKFILLYPIYAIAVLLKTLFNEKI
jgi:cellulose synthase/poly-beta-1,6-N-acetylglucosamine synthase-like glycosyltransferase